MKVLLKITAGALVLFTLQRILMPKYLSEAVDGRLIAEYYDSAQNHDVVFIGDCEVYENISPVKLWRDYGIASYVRGSPQQLIWQSYYLMEDTLRYETPKAFVFNVLSMKYGEAQSEAYNRLTLDGMRWSSSKVKAIQASMTKEENFISYVFPLLRFHARWSELKVEDFRYAFQATPPLSVNGYLMRVDVDGVDQLRQGHELGDYTIADVCWTYLDKMRALCEGNGVELILMKAPTNTPQTHWYDQWDEQVKAYAERYGLRYYNFLEVTEQIGLDYRTDTCDQGGHLNLSGAEKLSAYLGKILVDELNLTSHCGEAEYETVWAVQVERYDHIRKTQENLLRGKGKLMALERKCV